MKMCIVVNLLVKPRIFSRFTGKNIILCILKDEMSFKMHKIIFFPEKNTFLSENFQTCYPKHPYFFLFGLKYKTSGDQKPTNLLSVETSDSCELELSDPCELVSEP